MSQNSCKSQRYFELFSTNNQNLLNKWKAHASVKKVYDDQLKTFIYCLKGKSPVPLLHWPKDKTNVNLRHPVLVFQTYFSAEPNILIEIGVTSVDNQRKRIILSTNMKTQRVTLLSVSLPLAVRQDATWCHVFLDVEDVMCRTWKREELKSIDSISLGGVCSVKRIFGLRKDMIYNQEGIWLIDYNQLPKHMSLSKNLLQTYVSVLCSDDDAKADAASSKPSLSDQASSSLSSIHSSRNSLVDDAPKPKTRSWKTCRTTSANQSLGSLPISEDHSNAAVVGELPISILSALSFSNTAHGPDTEGSNFEYPTTHFPEHYSQKYPQNDPEIVPSLQTFGSLLISEDDSNAAVAGEPLISILSALSFADTLHGVDSEESNLEIDRTHFPEQYSQRYPQDDSEAVPSLVSISELSLGPKLENAASCNMTENKTQGTYFASEPLDTDFEDEFDWTKYMHSETDSARVIPEMGTHALDTVLHLEENPSSSKASVTSDGAV